MIGMNYAAQDLTIRLLQQLPVPVRQGVFFQALDRLDSNEAAQEQLQLCMMMAGELKERPEKYDTFEALSKTILARQKKEETNAPLDDLDDSFDTVTKKEVGKAMKFSNAGANKLLTRINEHKRELSSNEIDALISGFEKRSNRIFWKNQLYSLFPGLYVPEDGQEIFVQDCLRAVWNSLSQEERDTARYTFLPSRVWIDQLDQTVPEPPEEEDEEDGLYDLLEKHMIAVAHKHDGIKSKAYIQLNIDPDTYASYKRKWLQYEQNHAPLPRKRLSRKQLLCLALFLEMDFYTTALLLAKGCYAFHYEEADILVAKYLLKREGIREEIMEFLIFPPEKDS